MKFAKTVAAATAVAFTPMIAASAVSASECGLSCCIAAGVDGVGSNTGLSVSLQYDSMNMKTNKQGASKISNKQIIDNNLAGRANTPATSAMYGVSNKMTMQKFAANISYRMDENNAFVLTVPYIINDMEMMMGMKMTNGVGVTMPTTYSYSQMDTIRGLGDISLIYMRDIYKDTDIRTRQRLSVGFGIKAPTGDHKSRTNRGVNPPLVHMMMQAGTGAWDGLFIANGTMAFGEHEDGGAQWLLSPSAIYHMTTRNDLGYKVGDRFNLDVSARYRVTSKFNAKLDLNTVYSQKDSTDGTIDTATGLVAYQRATNVLDNVNNTGLFSAFISPGFQWIVADGVSVSGEYRIPVYQHVRGIQQVTDNWFFLRVSASF